jgi:sortase A
MLSYRRRIAIMATGDRGGPFVHANGSARNWMRAAAPGIAFKCVPRRESSPIDRGRKAIQNRRPWIVICITLLALAGAASFGGGAYLHAKAQLAQWLLHAAWSETRETGASVKPWPWADTHPVARLVAPAHDADVLVLAGASGRTLAFGPGHLDGSALPGDAGNAVITAHRDTHFRFLRTVAPGDELVVERADGASRHFRIRGAYVADYRDLRLPRDTSVPTLTLVTCYPFDAINPGGPLRYVVVAEAA